MSDDATQFVGVDWSGATPARDQRKAIWIAVVHNGILKDLSDGRTRAEATEHLIEIGKRTTQTIVGLDFAFSLPRWWLEEQGFDSAADAWEWAASRAAADERWMKALPLPFWGTNFRLRPASAFGMDHAEFRRTETESRTRGAIPMSVFRLFGPGTVGAQSLRGQPSLVRLRRAGFSIWPFDKPSWPVVVEVFPRLLVRQLAPGLERLSGDALRSAFLDATPPGLTGRNEHADVLRRNQDAFDAAVSAWALWYARAGVAELRTGELATDHRREGRIWSIPAELPPPIAVPQIGDGSPSRLAEIRGDFRASGHRLIIGQPTRVGPYYAFWVPATEAGGVARYVVGDTALDAAERALAALANPDA